MFGQIVDQPPDINIAKQSGRFPHRDGARAEAFDHQAETGEFLGPRRQPRGIRLVEFDYFRDQQDLPCDSRLVDGRFHALVDDPLMRGVLVDNDQTVAGLRHDISLVQLRARRAEGPVYLVRRSL